MRRIVLMLSVLIAALAVACADDVDDSGTGATASPAVATATTATGRATPLPDPGSWRVPDGTDIGTLERAWQVGTATRLSPYVEASTSETTGYAYFVFTAARDEIQVVASAARGGGNINAVHLYERASGGFGDELVPTRADPTGGAWDLTIGTKYIVEVVGPNGTFF